MKKEKDKILQYVHRFGVEKVEKKLKELEDELGSNEEELTIFCNAGVHHAPEYIKRGYIFEASRGNLDFSSEEAILREYTDILTKLSALLKARRWSKIYLVPFGHSTLSMNIKVLVYRITGMDTTDWFYLGELGYIPLSLPLRKIIASAPGQ